MEGNIKILGENSEQDSQRDLRGEDQEASGKGDINKGVAGHVKPCSQVKKSKGRNIMG